MSVSQCTPAVSRPISIKKPRGVPGLEFSETLFRFVSHYCRYSVLVGAELAESGTVGMLVCATGADTLFYRRTRRPRDPRRTREERSILLAGDDYSECADSGSGRTRCLGNGSVRNDERSVGWRAVMGDKYATSVPYLAFFTQK